MITKVTEFRQAIKISHLCEMTRCSPATIWRRIHADPSFPKPFKNGRSTLWDYKEVISWLESCKAKRALSINAKGGLNHA